MEAATEQLIGDFEIPCYLVEASVYTALEAFALLTLIRPTNVDDLQNVVTGFITVENFETILPLLSDVVILESGVAIHRLTFQK